jgi:hypothetical protein
MPTNAFQLATMTVGSGIGVLFYTTVLSGFGYLACRMGSRPLRGLLRVFSNVLATVCIAGLGAALVGTAFALTVEAARDGADGVFVVPLVLALTLVGLAVWAVRRIWETG